MVFYLHSHFSNVRDDGNQEAVRRVGNGPATKYILEIESVEILTQLQIAMDALKRRII